MTGVAQSPYSPEQISAWLQALMAIARADGHLDAEEQGLIAHLAQHQLATEADLATLQPITAAELAATLGQDPQVAENFLRTAVMAAVADGVYSSYEDDLLHQYAAALAAVLKSWNPCA